MKRKSLSALSLSLTLGICSTGTLAAGEQHTNNVNTATSNLTYPIVDTNSTECFGINNRLATCPAAGESTFGQDAQYQGVSASYSDNGDGTVTDNVTQLMWAQTTDINNDGEISIKDKVTYDEAIIYAKHAHTGGYADWRVPTIKELYSLMMFDGQDPSGIDGMEGDIPLIPFIDSSVFGFNSGDTGAGERLIDSQYISRTKYVSTTMKRNETVFGVNFIDGRIKGYGMITPKGEKTFYVLLVRGNNDYGINQFIDNGNNTISDVATNLTWQKDDSQVGMDWPSALEYCENLNLAGSDTWRLPNAKELQSIVDYTKSPDTSNSASIDSMFYATPIKNETGVTDFANYWSSSTHVNLKTGGGAGAYVTFGRSLGYMNGQWVDVHGAGSQRSDPKVGDANQFPTGHGPQGDAIRIDNYVRCVSSPETGLVEQPEVVEREAVVFTLTGDELLTAQHPGGQFKGRVYAGMDSRNRRPPTFEEMDINSDGQLSKDEVKGPLSRDFDKIDADGDGALSAEELPEPPAVGQRP